MCHLRMPLQHQRALKMCVEVNKNYSTLDSRANAMANGRNNVRLSMQLHQTMDMVAHNLLGLTCVGALTFISLHH